MSCEVSETAGFCGPTLRRQPSKVHGGYHLPLPLAGEGWGEGKPLSGAVAAALLPLLADHELREVVDLFLGQLAAELRHLVAVAEQQRVARVGDDGRDPFLCPAAFQVGAVVLARAVEVVAGVAVAGRQQVAPAARLGRVDVGRAVSA